MSDQRWQEIGEQMATDHATTTGQLFGKPCLKTGKTPFAAYFKGEMVFKIGREEVEQMKVQYPGSVNFDPSGKNRPMKDWLQVPQEYAGDWGALAVQALHFVEDNA